MRRSLTPLLAVVLVSVPGCGKDLAGSGGAKTRFDAAAAMQYTKQVLDFGPRVPGTPPHEKTADWITAEMKKRTDSVTTAAWTQKTATGVELPLRNILARFNPAAAQRVLYLTHWDTRPVADDDPSPEKRTLPIPGANDGASGVGLFLALADVFQKAPPSIGVDLLFVDGEDWGSFDLDASGACPDALFGSQYFASHLPSPDYKPLFGVLFDMIGDADLQIFQEAHSLAKAPEIVNRVWRIAAHLGYDQFFLPKRGGLVTDDHLPLLNKGLRVIDVIDIQYGTLPAGYAADTRPSPNYHHTMQDTFDKLSAKSFQVVGDVAVTLVE